jgi:hypothetical protein
MDAGRVVEFDTPRALWAKETSVFRKLADESEIPLSNLSEKLTSTNTPNVEVTVAEVNDDVENNE